MTTHPEHDLLSAYVDGDLDAAEQRTVDTHLAGCDEARALLRAIRATVADLALIDMPAMDPQVGFAIRSGLARERKLATRSKRYTWIAGAAAASLVAIFSVAIVANGNNDSARTLGGGTAATAPDLLALGDLSEQSVNEVLQGYVRENFTMEAAGGSPARDDAAGTGLAAEPETQPYGTTQDAATFAQCLRTIERESAAARLVRSLAATYKGEPAYLLIFEIPADRPERVEIWVTTRDTCETRYFAQERVTR